MENMILQPIVVGGQTFKNRIMFPPLTTGYEKNGMISEQDMGFYTRLAKGGVGYNGPVLLLRADDDRLVDEGTCSRYAEGYTAPEVDTIAGGGHNFATLTARAAVEEKTAAFIKAHL